MLFGNYTGILQNKKNRQNFENEINPKVFCPNFGVHFRCF